jgi:hypothetical protein
VTDHTALNVTFRGAASMEEFRLAENLRPLIEYSTVCNKKIGDEK